ncbi:type II toxin-antitoxin system RelE/ParE family toxin [Desulfotruncus arcticus]|uniref:type II toxin-antitoxin system RelE/ParE family toxin n=1 Tax=Desulfotruncus arcticus TaxID=341036 RepID=UPI000B80ACFA
MKSYISRELSNPQAAVSLISKITKKIRRLAEHPGIGAPLSSIVDIQTDYRFLVCASYLIFYRYEGGNVFVSRILYGKRDYMRNYKSYAKQDSPFEKTRRTIMKSGGIWVLPAGFKFPPTSCRILLLPPALRDVPIFLL